MTNLGESLWWIGIAWRLDRLRWVPRGVLDVLVRRDGACMSLCVDETEPAWLEECSDDRQLAAWLCGGCLVQDECLELEFRDAGETTIGVWGALSEEDRLAVYPHWLARGERAEDTDPFNGGDARCSWN